MENKNIFRFLLVIGLLMLNACSVQKFIPKESKLYGGATIIIINKHQVKGISDLKVELEELLRPDANSKILGARIGLYYHYKIEQGKKGFITKYMNKKYGEKPVFYEDVSQSKVIVLLKTV